MRLCTASSAHIYLLKKLQMSFLVLIFLYIVEICFQVRLRKNDFIKFGPVHIAAIFFCVLYNILYKIEMCTSC